MTDLKLLIPQYCEIYDLPIPLVASIILQESSGESWATRWEEGFYLKYVAKKQRNDLIGHIPKNISLATEKLHRACSWGVMQIMGQTARELGFAEDSLVKLCLPQLGLKYGCLYLIRCMDGRNIEQAMLKWNGGGNPNYPHQVLARIDSGEYDKLLK